MPTLFAEQHKVVQINTSYYDSKWGSAQNPAKKNTWNWVAFFFPLFWLAHRKMYKWFLVFGLIGTLKLLPQHFSDNPIWGYINTPYYLVIAIIVGWFGNRWYYNHTSQVLKQAKALPESQKDAYLQKKGGTNIGMMLGLCALLYLFYFVADGVFYILPTETNVKTVVSMSDEGLALEFNTDEPRWKYVKREGDHHVVEFTGYDKSKKENLHIVFFVYFIEDSFEWKQIYINGKKLSKKEAEDYEFRIVEELSY
ncbi:DUF2628 domain-containing protein [Neobacillus sp. NRS-1170]|uniref:DUF2628 domain-containing protein n=1 Tax=Neobacillus sp. NRS-1170 TaxID=3233898 RepID=UPI003D2C2A0A